MKATRTVPVPDTDLSVTFDPESYSGAAVWLHATDAHYTTGEAIGTLGSIVHHGRNAKLGTVEWSGGWMALVAQPWHTFIERLSFDDAAVKMARLHLDHASAVK